jgi:hypothetical protein
MDLLKIGVVLLLIGLLSLGISTKTLSIVNISANYANGQTAWVSDPFSLGSQNYVHYENDGSVRLDSCPATYERQTWLVHSVVVTPGQIVFASALLKASVYPNASPDPSLSGTIGGAILGIDFYDSNHTMLGGVDPKMANGGDAYVLWGSDWTNQSLTVAVPNGTARIQFWVQARPYDTGSVSAWFTNTNLYVADNSTVSPVSTNQTYTNPSNPNPSNVSNVVPENTPVSTNSEVANSFSVFVIFVGVACVVISKRKSILNEK